MNQYQQIYVIKTNSVTILVKLYLNSNSSDQYIQNILSSIRVLTLSYQFNKVFFLNILILILNFSSFTRDKILIKTKRKKKHDLTAITG